MKAVLFHEYGGVDQLVYGEAPTPELRSGEALIRVRACAINRIDLMLREGNRGFTPTLPHIPGVDIAGEVVAAESEDSGGWQVGDRVVIYPWLSCAECEFCQSGDESLCPNFRMIGQHLPGGYAQYVKAPIDSLIRLPDAFPYAQAAAACTTYMTAWRLLVTKGCIKAGEIVLVQGASGGVGSAALQIAKSRGAHVIAVVPGEAKASAVRELGADYVINTEEVKFHRAAREITDKRGVDVVVDVLGGGSWPQSLRSLARGGRLLACGFVTGFMAEIDLRFVIWKQLSIVGSTMGNRHDAQAAFEQVFLGKLRPVIDMVLPLARARHAHQRIIDDAHVGKIVLEPE